MYCSLCPSFSLLFLLFTAEFSDNAKNDDQKMIGRRNLLHSHNHHHRFRENNANSKGSKTVKKWHKWRSSSFADSAAYLGTNKLYNDQMAPFPFVMKCPQTTKNVCAVLWSHNGTALFSVFLRDDGKQKQTVVEVVNEAAADDGEQMVAEEKQKKWHTKDGAIAMIFMAKRGRYKFEVETGGKTRKAWFVLRINEVNVEEDSGDWRCQLFVVDGTGRVRAEAESRKSIGDRWKMPYQTEKQLIMLAKNNGRQMRKREEQHHHDNHSLFSFSFSKTDTEFVVFERMTKENIADNGGDHGTTQQLAKKSHAMARKFGDEVTYNRMDSVKKASSGKIGHLDNDIWLMRWHSALGTRRQSNWATSLAQQSHCQLNILLTAFLLFFKCI